MCKYSYRRETTHDGQRKSQRLHEKGTATIIKQYTRAKKKAYYVFDRFHGHTLTYNNVFHTRMHTVLWSHVRSAISAIVCERASFPHFICALHSFAVYRMFAMNIGTGTSWKLCGKYKHLPGHFGGITHSHHIFLFCIVCRLCTKTQGALDASHEFLSCVPKCYAVVHAMCTINSCDSIANVKKTKWINQKEKKTQTQKINMKRGKKHSLIRSNTRKWIKQKELQQQPRRRRRRRNIHFAAYANILIQTHKASKQLRSLDSFVVGVVVFFLENM